LFVIGPEVPVQPVWPDSKPPLVRAPPVGGGVVPPQVSVLAGTEIAAIALSTAVHSAEPAP
jgi:hypothetical protein